MEMQEQPTAAQHELSERDILCTQDKSLRNHSGNRFFRSYIDKMLPLYKSANSKSRKMSITREIVESILQSHRFVKFEEDSASWVEASQSVSREKVGHALRNAMRKEKKLAFRRSVSRRKTIQRPPLSAFERCETSESDSSSVGGSDESTGYVDVVLVFAATFEDSNLVQNKQLPVAVLRPENGTCEQQEENTADLALFDEDDANFLAGLFDENLLTSP